MSPQDVRDALAIPALDILVVHSNYLPTNFHAFLFCETVFRNLADFHRGCPFILKPQWALLEIYDTRFAIWKLEADMQLAAGFLVPDELLYIQLNTYVHRAWLRRIVL